MAGCRTRISDFRDCDIDDSFEYLICGWVSTIRIQKKMIFAKMYDSAESQFKQLQVIFTFDYFDETSFAELKTISTGTSLKVYGKLVKSPSAEQSFELIAIRYKILGKVSDPATYPMAKTELSLDYLRQFPQYECHSKTKALIYGIRSALMSITQQFFDRHKFTKCDMPLITFSECEGGCQPMQVTLFLTQGKTIHIPVKQLSDEIDFSKDFFGSKASVTVSAQLELETQLPLGDVWTMTRAVRGEPSQTTRHLCEFSMLEFEMGFIDSAEDIMEISELYIKHCIEQVLIHFSEEFPYIIQKFGMQGHCEKLKKWCDEPFHRITHADAVTLMLSQPSEIFTKCPAYDDDLSSEHEKWICAHFDGPVIVMKYPKIVKAFYMPVVQETIEESHSVEHVDSFDILVDGVELVGGSARVWDYDELSKRIDELKMARKPLEYYLDLRKDGSIPHGGMGMGFERLVRLITGAPSVKDCVAFPRFIGCGK